MIFVIKVESFNSHDAIMVTTLDAHIHLVNDSNHAVNYEDGVGEGHGITLVHALPDEVVPDVGARNGKHDAVAKGEQVSFDLEDDGLALRDTLHGLLLLVVTQGAHTERMHRHSTLWFSS